MVLLLLAGGVWQARAQQPDAAPVNAEASPEARALLKMLDGVSGKEILSGEHNYPNTVSRYSDRVLDLTGKFPAIFGQDFGFAGGDDKDSTLSRATMVREVIRQYRAGAIPALCWHAVPPTEEEPVPFQGSILSHLSDWEYQQLLTPGTELHMRWERQVDRIAGYLRELQDAGVPVLFRPYHEMNGNWFWWGGRPGERGTSALYRMLFDRYVHVHHLNNLLWVWNVAAASKNSGAPDQYWPGAAYVDVVSMDIYRPFTDADYESMLQLAGVHKPVALAEVGTLPDPEVLVRQPRWTYFMVWAEFAEDHNTLEGLRRVYALPRVLSRGDTPQLSARVAPVVTVPPTDLKASAATVALLNRLHAAGAKVTEVDATGMSASALGARVRASRAEGAVPLVRWSPRSPTGAEGKLDSFEWAELRRPGSALRSAWLQELQAFGTELQGAAGEPLLLSALPGTPGESWYSRAGVNGTQALLGDVYETVRGSGGHNVLWVWEAGTVTVPSQVPFAVYDGYYPGPLHVDALLLDAVADPASRDTSLKALREMTAGQPVGIRGGAAEMQERGVTSDFAVTPVAPTQ